MGTTCRQCGATAEGEKGEGDYCGTCQRPFGASPEKLVGETLGNYQVQRFIGEGPVGMVYEATHEPSGDKVRLKVFDTELLVTEPYLIESATQIVIGSTGSHPGLPELVEVAIDKPELRSIAVEWIEGNTLRDYLLKNPLPEAEACRVVGGVLEALAALHDDGLAHHDIKPENVLITSNSIHVLDVGPSLISARARLGAHYRAPEQARGGDGAEETDIYACGVLLYEALTGSKPYDSHDYDVLMSQISLRRASPIEQVDPSISPGLAKIVTKAMEPDAGHRFGSAKEMLEAIKSQSTDASHPQSPAIAPVAANSGSEAATTPVSPAAAPSSEGSMLTRSDLPPPPPKASPRQEQGAISFDFMDDKQAVPTSPLPPAQPAVSPTEASSEQGGSGMKWAAIIFVILAVVVGGSLIYYTFVAGQESRTEPEISTSQQVSGTQPPAQKTKSRGTVRIKLSGLPERAQWTVDGRQLRANPFRAPKGNTVHKIRVEAPDYEPFETEVSFLEDLEIAVEMTAIESVETKRIGPIKAYTSGFGANKRYPKRQKMPQGGIVPIEEPAKSPGDLRVRGPVTPR